jgi:fatty-acyl-CoA synthase
MEQFRIRTLADIEAIETVPIEARLEGLNSTYDAIARAARRTPDAVALAFLAKGDSAAAAIEVNYRELLGKVTQARTTSFPMSCRICSKRITRSGAARPRGS